MAEESQAPIKAKRARKPKPARVWDALMAEDGPQPVPPKPKPGIIPMPWEPQPHVTRVRLSKDYKILEGKRLYNSMSEEEIDKACWQMRQDGWRYKEIADYFAMSVAETEQHILRGIYCPDREAERSIHAARLDAMLKVHLRKAIDNGDDRSAKTCLQILERQSLLMGLDAAKKTENINTTEVQGQLDLVRKLPDGDLKTIYDMMSKAIEAPAQSPAVDVTPPGDSPVDTNPVENPDDSGIQG